MLGLTSKNQFFAGVGSVSRSVAVALMATALLLAVTSADAAQQRPQFNIKVELVQLQVGVADASGRFVRGLTADDFVVVVDGDPRPAQVVYEIDLRTEDRRGVAAMAGPRRAEPRPVAARRHFLLFFDFSFTTRRGIREARRAALDFVAKNIRESDLVGVATANRYGIKLLTPFTSNHETVDLAIQGLGLANASDIISGGFDFEESIREALADMQAGPGGDAGALVALPAMEFREYVAQVSNYIDQLVQFGEMLQAIEGRKHFVMFSAGFQDRALVGAELDELSQQQEARSTNPAAVASSDPEMAWGAAEVRDGMQKVVEMFRNADAVVHAIDPSGLRSERVGHQSLTYLATGTGGEAYWNLNDLSVALAAIEETTASFYMIAYLKSPDDAGTVDIEVRVGRPGVRVISAPERLTPPPDFVDMNEMQRQLQLAEVMADDVDRRVIAFDSLVTTFPARGDRAARAALVLEINGLEIDRIARLRGTDEIQLEIAGFALAEDDTIVAEFRRKVKIDVAAMREAGRLQEQAFRYSDYVDVPVGDGRLRLLLREAAVGELSATTHSFHAYTAEPEEGMIVARPMVVDDVTTPPLPDPEGRFDPLEFEGRRFAPIAAPSVAPGGSIEVLVIVYNIPKHPVTGEYLAGLVLELEEVASGDSYRLQDFQIIGTSSTEEMGATRMLVQVPIPGHIRPGPARLWARIVDQITGARREEQTALFINSQ